jgi:mannose-6-phosphate isomerase-like protein (cupin superfamily)
VAGSSHNEGPSSSPLLKQGAFFALMSERLFGNFKISKTIATALVTVHPGGVRELHWHPNANEWQYYISGKARMTVFAAAGRARTMDFDAGDVGYVQRAMGHYIENTGDTDLRFLEMFKSDRYEDISLAEWMSHTPPELVAQHLHLDMAMIESNPKKEMTVVPVWAPAREPRRIEPDAGLIYRTGVDQNATWNWLKKTSSWSRTPEPNVVASASTPVRRTPAHSSCRRDRSDPSRPVPMRP